MSRSQTRKKGNQVISIFALLGSRCVKTSLKHVVEIEPCILPLPIFYSLFFFCFAPPHFLSPLSHLFSLYIISLYLLFTSPSFPLFFLWRVYLKETLFEYAFSVLTNDSILSPFSLRCRRKRINVADAVKDRKGLLIFHSNKICGHYFHFYRIDSNTCSMAFFMATNVKKKDKNP